MRWLIAAVAVVAAYALWTGFRQADVQQEAGDPEALNDLRRVALADYLKQPEISELLLVFNDGHGGWWAIDDPVAILDRSIGVGGAATAGDEFVGASHVPTTDDDGGKQFLLATKGEVLSRRAFSDPNHLDFRTLMPIARPVALHLNEVSQEDYAAEVARISAIEEAEIVYLESQFRANAFSMRLSGMSILWHGLLNMPKSSEIEQAVAQILPDGTTVEVGYEYLQQVNGDSVALQIDGEPVRLEGHFGADISLFVSCRTPEICADVNVAAVNAMLARWHDDAVFASASESAVPFETDSDLPELEKMRASKLAQGPTQIITYPVSYIVPRQVDSN